MNTFWRTYIAVLIIVSVFHSALARGGERLPNFDIRERRPRVQATDEQEKGIAELKREKPDVKIALDAQTGSPRSISSVHGFLTDADPQFVVALNRPAIAQQLDHQAPVKRYLQTHAAIFGHGDEVLTKSRIKRNFVTEHNGLRSIVWEQELDDIPVFNGVLIGHITRRGELVHISSLMVPSAEQAAEPTASQDPEPELPSDAESKPAPTDDSPDEPVVEPEPAPQEDEEPGQETTEEETTSEHADEPAWWPR